MSFLIGFVIGGLCGVIGMCILFAARCRDEMPEVAE